MNVKNTDKCKLTHPQLRVFYLEKMFPNSSVNNIGGVMFVKGKIDNKRLNCSFNRLLRENNDIRRGIVEEGSSVKQFVYPYEPYIVEHRDFSKQESFDNWVDEIAQQPFLFNDDRLYFLATFNISDYISGYIIKFHHLIADGWSMEIFVEKLKKYYELELSSVSIEVQDIDKFLPYEDYMKREKKYLESKRINRNRLFWKRKFSDSFDHVDIKELNVKRGNRKSFVLEGIMSKKINEYVNLKKCSLNTYFITVYLLYIRSFSNENTFTIGTPVLNRSGRNERKIFGMFTSTMPFRFTIDANSSFSSLLLSVKESLFECYLNQQYPYELLLSDLNIGRRGANSLFDVSINYYNTKMENYFDGMEVENYEFYNGFQLYSLQIIVKEWSDRDSISLDFDYQIDEYLEKDIIKMYEDIVSIGELVMNNDLKPIKELCLMTDNELQSYIYDFNKTYKAYPSDKTLNQLFEDQVEKTPNRVAVSDGNQQITYSQLNKRANELAREIIRREVELNSPIGLFMDNSMEIIIGIIGILKAGRHFLPIDLACPIDRIKTIVNDSNPQVIITDYNGEFWSWYGGTIINVNDKFDNKDRTNINITYSSSSLAYVIYTSGSTGCPKGVLVSNQSIVNYVWWAKEAYIDSLVDKFAFYSSIAFDFTLTSIFVPLISGSEIIVYRSSDEDDEFVLHRIISDNKANIIKLTPAHLQILSQIDVSDSIVNRIIVGGDIFRVKRAKEIHSNFNGNCEILNEYGPTEAVVGCMIHKYDVLTDNGVSVPVGKPIDNVQIYVLNTDMKPARVGGKGEIYIAGDCVANGYLNQFELTNQCFVRDALISNQTMYKTGDYAKILKNGDIEFLSRVDRQVKINGYRIELNEIEIHIMSHIKVKTAHVIERSDNNNEVELYAYIVSDSLSRSEMIEYLTSRLPMYMIPKNFVFLDNLPMNINGKVDTEYLLEFDDGQSEVFGEFDLSSLVANDFIECIRNIFNDIEIAPSMSFYRLGGDSIKAIQLSSILREKGYSLKVKDIMANPILIKMIECIRKIDQETNYTYIMNGEINPTPIVNWYFNQTENQDYGNCQCMILDIYNDLSKFDVLKVFDRIVFHHDSLRVNYDFETMKLFYNNKHLTQENEISVIDNRGLDEEEGNKRIREVLQLFKSEIDIANDLLIKFYLVLEDSDSQKLLMCAHHIIMDVVSWKIIVDDIKKVAESLRNDDINMPLYKTDSFMKWSEKLYQYLLNDDLSELTYWNNILSKDSVGLKEENTSFISEYGIDTVKVKLNSHHSRMLLNEANKAYNTDPLDLLVASVYRTISQLNNQYDLVIELENHGRYLFDEDADFNRTIGWFTNIFPIHFDISDENISIIIKKVKDKLREIPNKGVGFGVYKYLGKYLIADTQERIKINYLGDIFSDTKENLLELLYTESVIGINSMYSLTNYLDINCMSCNDEILFFITYTKSRFNIGTIQMFANRFIETLEKFIIHCISKQGTELTPSDFDTLELSYDDLDKLFN